MTNQITTHQPQRNIFATNEADVRAARALKMMLPYGHLLTDDNALALLIYGRAHDLDPLNGECYFLVRESKDKQTGDVKRTELGCYPGIKGKRKHARSQLLAQQGTYKISYFMLDGKSISALGLKPEEISVAMKGELRDTISEGQYLTSIIRLSQAGYTKEEIEGILGKPPTVVGYGVVKASEVWALKQPPAIVARKRCENDCITQRFDLPLDDTVADDAAPEITTSIEPENGNGTKQIEMGDEPTDAEFTVTEQAPESKAKPRTTEQQLLAGLGF